MEVTITNENIEQYKNGSMPLVVTGISVGTVVYAELAIWRYGGRGDNNSANTNS